MKSKSLFAEFVSTIFNPVVFVLLMPFFVVYRQTDSEWYALKWVVFTGAFVFVGLLFFLYGRMKGFYSDHDISIREQRHSLYLIAFIASVFYFLAAVFFKGIFFPLSIIALGVILGVIVFEIANFYIKASVHMAVVVGFVISLGLIYGPFAFLASFWIILMVAWSRLYLKRHTMEELLMGGLLGTFITIFTYMVGVQLFYN